mgnify:CR=1 FL=1
MTQIDPPQEPDVLAFWSMALQLKRLRRQGWIDRGVNAPESSADHSWAVALLAWLLSLQYPNLDRDRVVLMALVHDLPEALAGDATPFDDIRAAHGALSDDHFRQMPPISDASRRAKRHEEETALELMTSELPKSIGTEIREAWLEYENGETAEAAFVKQIDKLETLLQAEDYRGRQPGLVIDSFRLGAERAITDPILVELLERSKWGRQQP